MLQHRFLARLAGLESLRGAGGDKDYAPHGVGGKTSENLSPRLPVGPVPWPPFSSSRDGWLWGWRDWDAGFVRRESWCFHKQIVRVPPRSRQSPPTIPAGGFPGTCANARHRIQTDGRVRPGAVCREFDCDRFPPKTPADNNLPRNDRRRIDPVNQSVRRKVSTIAGH